MSKRETYLINSGIVVLLMFGVRFLPNPDFISREGLDTIGLLLGCLWGWTTVGTVWPSLLCLIGLGFIGENTVTDVFMQGFGGQTFILVLMFTIFAGIIDQSGLGEYLASRMLSSKMVKRSAWALSAAILAVAYCTAFLISVVPGIFVTWTMLDGICRQCGFTRKDLWPKVMVVGVVLACCMGHSALPIEALAFTLLGMYKGQTGSAIGYIPFTVMNVAIGVVAIVLYLVAIRYLIKPDMSKIRDSDLEIVKTGALTRFQKQMIALVLVFFLVLFVPGAFPDAGGIVGVLNAIGTAGCAALVVAAAALARRRDGTPFVDMRKAIGKGVPWDAMFLLAAAMPLAAELSSDETGLSGLLDQLFSQMFSGIDNALLFTALFILMVVVMTNVLNNMTVGIIMVPFACLLAPAVGANAALLTAVSCIACNAALVLPSGGPTAAILHGNMNWFSSRGEISRYSIVAVSAFTVSALALSLTLGSLLF